MIFTAKNAFTLQWTLKDSSGVSVNTAVNLSATLYSGRLLSDPDAVPGLPVVPINSVSLVYVPSSQGVYQGAVPATLDPTQQQLAAGFVLVVDDPVLGYHNEAAAIVIPESVDLTTLDAVKSELNITSNNADSELQQYITAWSTAVLNRTGIRSFSQPVLMTETRDGNGNDQMFTRMRPIVNVVSVTISAVAVQAAGDWPSPGYYVSDDQRSIKLRNPNFPISYNYYPNYPGYNQSAAGFQRGQGNVKLVYWAGYTNVPADLEIASRRMVAIYYGRKQTRDLQSQGVAAGGTTATTRFRDWDVPPEICKVVDFYSRTAII